MTWMQTASGRAFDLLNPSADDVNFEVDVIPSLAKTGRFACHGPVESDAYSVGQHSVLGAHALYRDTGSKEMAAAFLLHDARESYIGDNISPMQRALAAYAGQIARDELGERAQPGGKRLVELAFQLMGHQVDAAIYTAAGITYPLPPDVAAKVKEYDLRMLKAEILQLLVKPPKPWTEAIEKAEPLRLKGKITIWPWRRTADEFCSAMKLYLPAALQRAA
ncbi:hypothetical protein [Microvirga solisilvae]|uniref:hypothetical protein n=1 Tax=Microvirga solisilvae TaxID=2919498 RepID=UPI001FAE756C|nr:hypothetical protein [Microvirga solisilvae]